MSARDDLQSRLERVVAGIGGLADRPAGDPVVLAKLAHDVEQHAAAAATLVGRETKIPVDITFDGEGARRLAANVAEVASSFGAASAMLEQAALTLKRRAQQLRQTQDAWARDHRALDEERRDLELRLSRERE